MRINRWGKMKYDYKNGNSIWLPETKIHGFALPGNPTQSWKKKKDYDFPSVSWNSCFSLFHFLLLLSHSPLLILLLFSLLLFFSITKSIHKSLILTSCFTFFSFIYLLEFLWFRLRVPEAKTRLEKFETCSNFGVAIRNWSQAIMRKSSKGYAFFPVSGVWVN